MARSKATLVVVGGFFRQSQSAVDEFSSPRKFHRPADFRGFFNGLLGIDPHREYQTNIGRPVMIVRDGEIIPELFA